MVRVHNKFKLDTNLLSPEEKFSWLKVTQSVKEEHTLFFPVYCLDAKLQGGIGGIPKWDPRSRLGIFVGHSPDHASDVALILNLRTGLVSPQYHVVFDDTFSAISHLQSEAAPSNWHHLVENYCENYTDDPKDTKLIDEIANTLPTYSKFVKNKSAMEKCLDLARDSNPAPADEALQIYFSLIWTLHPIPWLQREQ